MPWTLSFNLIITRARASGGIGIRASLRKLCQLLRFVRTSKNYLIPIFGVILGFVFLGEQITSKVIISLIAVIIGIYIVKKGSKIKEL